jgi:hypothetical protein
MLLFSLGTLLYVGTTVRADFITGTLPTGFSGPGGALNPGTPVYINDGNGSAANMSYYPGVVNWKLDSSNASWASSLGNSFQTFCIELTQDISPGGTYTYSLVNLADAPKPGTSQTGGSGGMGQAKANAIGALWAADYGSIAGPNADTNAAAFQLAIWKIEYDWGSSNESFNKGNFKASANGVNPNSTNAAIIQAENWLNSLGWNNNNVPNETNLIALSSPGPNGYQDQVMAIPTPEPSTFCLAGIGSVVLVLLGYRRQRSALDIVQSQGHVQG